MTSNMNEQDARLTRDIEMAAVEMARGAGEILTGSFGRRLSVEYKDKQQRDPVTSADKDTQQFLQREISRQFPGHGILGEEKLEEDGPQGPAPDYLWVLDPLDGTTNFLNGLPVYASSIGVLHRGRPVAGAVYIPWPTPTGGFVLHCRRGNGCFADGEPVSVLETEKPIPNRLTGLPGSFGQTTRFHNSLKGGMGELRVTGSIAYELALTAMGAMQYAVFGAPRMWDMLGGAIAVQEAGGAVMVRFRGRKKWQPLDTLTPNWEDDPPSLPDLRQWVAPVVAGNENLAPLIAHNLRPRFRPVAKFKRTTRRLGRAVKPKNRSN